MLLAGTPGAHFWAEYYLPGYGWVPNYPNVAHRYAGGGTGRCIPAGAKCDGPQDRSMRRPKVFEGAPLPAEAFWDDLENTVFSIVMALVSVGVSRVVGVVLRVFHCTCFFFPKNA